MDPCNFDLDTSLFRLTADENSEAFTIRDSVEGVLILGGIGSGKTSGSGKLLALRYLSSGYGGLVLTAKANEVDSWREYCSLTGRTNDLIVVEPGSNHYFNFLEYESSGHASISYTDNIFQVIDTVVKAGQERSSGKKDDAFWENASEMFIYNCIDLLMIAYGKVTVQLIYDVSQTAPKKKEVPKNAAKDNETPRPTAYQTAFEIAGKKVVNRIKEWEAAVGCDRSKLSREQYEERLDNEVADYRKLKMATMFFDQGLYNMPDKTRSIIEFSLAGSLFRLLRDPVYSLFCRYKSNFTPDECIDKGKIIVLNIPVKTYHKVGQDAQLMFKYIWQRAMERRDVKVNDRPVFLWADEAQLFLHEYDAEYQATARSSRIATVYITQNLPNFYANMCGEKAEYRVKSFLGTLASKVFHANADIETNEYASSLIGEAYFEDHSRSVQMSADFNVSKSTSYKLERIVRPEEFVGLKCGGPQNKLQVHAYIHMQGKQLQNNQNHQLISFNQNPIINQN